ncbi:MAG: UDP-glucose 4-epimerase [Smithella sp. PtaU1.Bin162]|nr:MAG: UDP-glucose 4-epimerase [Smithella sp. PtaU1.Bin162]
MILNLGAGTISNQTGVMKLLVTGHLGFIGSYLTKQLGDYVGYDIKNGHDTRNKLALYTVFENNNFDMVIHLAALPGVRKCNIFSDEYITTNITGTNNLLEMCKKFRVNKFLYFSSSSVLGGNYSDNGLNENAPYNPCNIYGITKVAGELLVKNSGLDYIIIRPFTVYGEKARPDMVLYKWINQVKSGKPITFYGDGSTSRGYTYITDLIDGVIKAINCLMNHSIKETYHLGGSEVITLSHLLKLFEQVKECQVDYLPMPDTEMTHSFADTTKALNDLGFKPSRKFNETIINILSNEFCCRLKKVAANVFKQQYLDGGVKLEKVANR